MAFTYNKDKRIAEDKERGIVLSQPGDLWADTNPPLLKFIYTSPKISCEFGVVSHEEERSFVNKLGKEVLRPVVVVMDVLEGTVSSGIRWLDKNQARTISPEKLSEIKDDIREGLRVLCMPRLLGEDVPIFTDLQIRFVRKFEDITRTPK